MYVFGNDSFIYVSLDSGCLCEVSMVNGEYKITFKKKEDDNDLHGNCICIVNNGKYLISGNKYCGCSIFKYAY